MILSECCRAATSYLLNRLRTHNCSSNHSNHSLHVQHGNPNGGSDEVEHHWMHDASHDGVHRIRACTERGDVAVVLKVGRHVIECGHCEWCDAMLGADTQYVRASNHPFCFDRPRVLRLLLACLLE